MTFTHLMNCFALTYGPVYSIYSASQISQYQAGKLFMKSMLYFGLYSVIKMVWYATIMPYSITENVDSYNLTQDILKVLINAIEIVFLFYLLQSKNNYTENQNGLKVLTISLGWCLAESWSTNLFYFLMNATGDEFTWEYIQSAIVANIELVEKIGVVALVECINRLNLEKKMNVHFVFWVLGYYAFNGLGYKYWSSLQGMNSWEVIQLKIAIAFGFTFLSKIVFGLVNKTEEQKAEEEYYQMKNKAD